jgi:cytochrome b6-f complex iron-sulfur subunit
MVKLLTMDRKSFLKTFGQASAGLVIASCLGACSRDEENRELDFTLDLSSNDNAALQNNGGSRVVNGVIVARTNTGDFIAVAARCTHQGTTVQFEANNQRFRCPNHGATFTTDGKVTGGPARTNLQQYQTTLSGNTLRVFSA